MEYANALYSEDIEWNLILGTDTYRDLVGGKWKRADDIVRIAKLHVFVGRTHRNEVGFSSIEC